TATTSTLTVGDFDQTATFGGTIRDSSTTDAVTLPDPNGGNTTVSVTAPWVTAGAKMALTKIGIGAQTLSGTNTYTGNTTISNGTLNVTGSLATTGNVLVNTSALAAATLTGNGTVGNVIMANAVGSKKSI